MRPWRHIYLTLAGAIAPAGAIALLLNVCAVLVRFSAAPVHIGAGPVGFRAVLVKRLFATLSVC